jgi:hypothetical protein
MTGKYFIDTKAGRFSTSEASDEHRKLMKRFIDDNPHLYPREFSQRCCGAIVHPEEE